MTLQDAISDAMKAMWIAFMLYWLVAARGAKPLRWREGWRGRALDTLLIVPALLLPMPEHFWPAALNARFVPRGWTLPLLGNALEAAGLGFAVWARVHLGREWSSVVALKQDHRLIRSGPYGFLRHPIYSGVLFALLGTALAIGAWRALLGVVCLAAAFLRRVAAEEKQLAQAFPDYAAYQRETAALIPFLY